MEISHIGMGIAVISAIVLSLLIFTFFSEPNPKYIDGVQYYYVNEPGAGINIGGFYFSYGGVTNVYDDGSLKVELKNGSPESNWMLRHENCHVQQILENRERSELECYVRMVLP